LATTLQQLLNEASQVPRAEQGVKIFADILAKGIRKGQIPARTSKAREWYRNQAQAVAKSGSKTGVMGQTLIKSAQMLERERAKSEINFYGEMYTFAYDAKHKDKLPYYDMFPLIFPIGEAKGGFLGINFHYLPPMMRAELMDALYSITSNKKYDETTRLKLSYSVLKSASKFRFFKPAIKHYLTSQVKSRFIYINPAEWDIALFLPTARFVGASKQKVYADSRKIIRGK
jgi:hypothetical protein